VLERLVDGRTDLVFDYLSQGHAATAVDSDGVALIKWCAYYGDVSGIRYLLIRGESLATLGANLDLSGAAFHGHWQLCQFLIENGADVNDGGDTGEHRCTRPCAKRTGRSMTRSSRYCWPQAPIRMPRPEPRWKRIASCGIAERKARRRFTAAPRLAANRRSTCSWKRGLAATSQTLTAIHL